MNFSKSSLYKKILCFSKLTCKSSPSPVTTFLRYEWLKADGYGKVCMDGKHFYSTSPENANKQVLVGIRAHTVDILTEGGQVVTTHRRAYGDNRTDISDYSTTSPACQGAVFFASCFSVMQKRRVVILGSTGSIGPGSAPAAGAYLRGQCPEWAHP